MKNTFNLAAAGSVIALLLAATPALAFNGSEQNRHAGGLDIRLAPIARFFDNGKGNAYGKFKDDTIGSTSVSFGSVSSVNGSMFTVAPGKANATTTVTTNAATVYKLNGAATTSAALQSGAHVVVIGTTTSTSTSGKTVTASIVIILEKMVGFCKHLFSH